MGGIYWDVLGETGVYSQQCQYGYGSKLGTSIIGWLILN